MRLNQLFEWNTLIQRFILLKLNIARWHKKNLFKKAFILLTTIKKAMIWSNLSLVIVCSFLSTLVNASRYNCCTSQHQANNHLPQELTFQFNNLSLSMMMKMVAMIFLSVASKKYMMLHMQCLLILCYNINN